MFDYELIREAESVRGAFWKGGAKASLIKKWEENGQVSFPDSYVYFLGKYGAGGFSGTYINGIEQENFSSIIDETLQMRQEFQISEKWFVLSEVDNDEHHFIDCLDTSVFHEGECQVIRYDLRQLEQIKVMGNFKAYFNWYTALCLQYKFR